MRIPSLLLCSAKNAKSVQVVLRGRCSSVDEPIQGSTPALVIHDSLTTPTPKHSLTICSVCRFRQLCQFTFDKDTLKTSRSLIPKRQRSNRRQNRCIQNINKKRTHHRYNQKRFMRRAITVCHSLHIRNSSRRRSHPETTKTSC
jgi:hypothetical protein